MVFAPIGQTDVDKKGRHCKGHGSAIRRVASPRRITLQYCDDETRVARRPRKSGALEDDRRPT
jgi:hypothetical protein